MWLLLSFSLLIALLICDYLYKRRRCRILETSGIPGPAYTLPFIGDALELIGNTTLNIFAVLQRLAAELGKVYRLWIFHRLILVLKDPKYLEVILSSQQVIKKPFIYDMFSCWLGDGLLLSYGTKWHSRRKILTPSYHFKILEEFVEVFDRQSNVLVQKLATIADGKNACDIYPIISLTALDIISETAMGVKINAQNNPQHPYAMAVKTAAHILGTRNVNPIQYYDISFLLTAFPSYLKLRKNVKIMHDFANHIINDRRAQMFSQNLTTEKPEEIDVGQKKRMAFLDVLLRTTVNGKILSQKDIREEVDTFMFEGHDTTTSAISHCLYILSRHADVQQKVFEEVVDVFGPDKDEPITMSKLQELKYLEAVIKETLRMYPSVPLIARECLQDIQVGDKVIPANTTIVILIYAAGRDGDYFHEPNKFNAERFFTEPPDNINAFANVPFSAGPRNCIGQKFALLEMKSVISRVVRNYELLSLGEDLVPLFKIILDSATGMQLGLKRRIE